MFFVICDVQPVIWRDASVEITDVLDMLIGKRFDSRNQTRSDTTSAGLMLDKRARNTIRDVAERAGRSWRHAMEHKSRIDSACLRRAMS